LLESLSTQLKSPLRFEELGILVLEFLDHVHLVAGDTGAQSGEESDSTLKG
jgi:hypothetical protein